MAQALANAGWRRDFETFSPVHGAIVLVTFAVVVAVVMWDAGGAARVGAGGLT